MVELFLRGHVLEVCDTVNLLVDRKHLLDLYFIRCQTELGDIFELLLEVFSLHKDALFFTEVLGRLTESRFNHVLSCSKVLN